MIQKPKKTALRLLAFFLASVLLVGTILPAGRSLTGDAPALLGRARHLTDTLRSGDILGALGAGIGQVVPQPPLGYAMAGATYLLGAGHAAPVALSLLSLLLIGIGLSWAAGEARSPLGLAPLAAGGMLLASPMTWAAVEHVQWDLLCAGWICLSLGALVRSDDLTDRRWTIAAGGLAGLATLVKYNAPFFLSLPLLVSVIVAVRAGRGRDAGALVAAGAAPLLVWLPFSLAELGPYLASSFGGTSGVDSASDVPGLAERLRPAVLAYYPAVFKDALGWPGVALCAGALGARRLREGRVLWLAMLGGALCLSLVGRREPRYLLPLLPLAMLAAELGWGRLRHRAARAGVAVALVGVFGAQLVGTVRAYRDWPDPRPLAQLGFGPENLTRLGDWPSPEVAFVPTSSLAEAWKVAPAVSALAAELGEETTVGFLLYAHPRVPPADLFVLEAARQGQRWVYTDLEILSAHHVAPPPPPGIEVGRVQGVGGPDPHAPRLPDQPPPRRPEDEDFVIKARSGPVSRLVDAPQFSLLYTIHPGREPFFQAFFAQLGAEQVERFVLPSGFVGTIWRLGDGVWDNELGIQLFQTLKSN